MAGLTISILRNVYHVSGPFCHAALRDDRSAPINSHRFWSQKEGKLCLIYDLLQPLRLFCVAFIQCTTFKKAQWKDEQIISTLSLSHGKTKPGTEPRASHSPAVPVSWSHISQSCTAAAGRLLRNKINPSTSLKPGSGWLQLNQSSLNHLNLAEFLLREKMLQIPCVNKRGNHCGCSWKSVMEEELGIHGEEDYSLSH